MLDAVYEWIKNAVFYLVIVTAVLEVLPGDSYKKYIRFFSGMIMILLVLTPIMRLTGVSVRFEELYRSREAELRREELERQADYFESVDLFDFVPEEYLPEDEKREEIRIGEDKEQDSDMDAVGK